MPSYPNAKLSCASPATYVVSNTPETPDFFYPRWTNLQCLVSLPNRRVIMNEQACARCGQFKPREAYRVRATPAQKQRWNKDWVTSSVCDTCRKPPAPKPTLGPVGLFKKLTNAGLPAPIIEHRVAQRAHINKTRRIAGLRKTWRAKHKEDTAQCLAALDREAKTNRSRLVYTESPPLINALSAYNHVLIAARADIKRKATGGAAPPNPWHNAIPKEQKLELIRIFTDAMERATSDHTRAYIGRAQPSWWSEFVMSQNAAGVKQAKGE